MRKTLSILMLMLATATTWAQRFTMANGTEAATICVSESDERGVARAAVDLALDIERVAGVKASVNTVANAVDGKGHVIIGTIGHSPLIDNLIANKRLNVKEVKGQWESYVVQMVDGNLVVAGSDRRGTIYGIYSLSREMGVSPWHYWADVVPQHRDEVSVSGKRRVQPSPKVKYRGIFINDEWPSFGGWCNQRFGGVNSKMYATMFELILRLGGNYLWPAMWDSAFNEDDPETQRLADEYGIVMGTSHHEPMMRAHKEYTRRRKDIGAWDYRGNRDNIERFFTEGVERAKSYDNMITIGMRGDGDVALGKDDDECMATLKEVVKGQRDIIEKVYGKPASEVPQMWAIFTEVQRYYDKGFTVPDDVLLLFCDNNWGYIRRTGPEKERNRRGGMGLYYHIDMNGGPWNDRWVNTSPLPRLREQLYLAYATGLDDLWIINVGDLKPKELPIDFIMQLAWNPEAIGPDDVAPWTRRWAAATFGDELADDIAFLISRYPKYNQWRKAEVQSADIMSVENYNEAGRVEALWLELTEKAEALKPRVPQHLQDAYYQLVYYPVCASSAVARLWIEASRNKYYASIGDAARANTAADRMRQLFREDSLLTAYYNNEMADGKWKNMMSDKHIGYTKWSMPAENKLPSIATLTPPQPSPTGEGALKSPATDNTVDKSNFSTPSPVGEGWGGVEFSLAAIRPTRNIAGKGCRWRMLPDLGRDEGCMGIWPVTAPSQTNLRKAPRLEYDITLPDSDRVTLCIGIAPTQDVNPERGLRLAVAIDNQEPIVLDCRQGMRDEFQEYTPQNLAKSPNLKPLPPQNRNIKLKGVGLFCRQDVYDYIRWLDITLPATAGKHTLKLIMVDPEVVVEKIIVNPDNDHPSYFGAPCVN